MDLLRLARDCHAKAEVAPLLDVVPYARWLGVEGRVEDEGLLFVLPFREELLGNPILRALHGGVMSAFLEHAAAMELIWRLESRAIPKTVSITVDYLRPARAATTYARAGVTKLGRRASAVSVRAWQESEDKPIAQAHGHFLASG